MKVVGTNKELKFLYMLFLRKRAKLDLSLMKSYISLIHINFQYRPPVLNLNENHSTVLDMKYAAGYT
jgi:hypothetical protein